MKVVPVLIEESANIVVGSNVFDDALRIATTLRSKELSNDEKRKIAVDELISLGHDVEEFLLRLAVAMAVAWLDSKKQ